VTTDARDAVLNLCRALVGLTETNGSNRSEMIDKMVRLTGLDPARRVPWCAAAVAWIGYAILRKLWPLRKVAGCVSLRDDLAAKGLLRTEPARGAVFLIYGKAGDGVWRFKHTGFCGDQLPDGRWQTFEGNTNTDGSAEGTGYFERVRSFGKLDRFGYWWEEVTPAVAPRLAA
jgi:hypothetical protein